MRLAVLVGFMDGRWRLVRGTLDDAQTVARRASDRTANGEAFPGECRVRLPRRVADKLTAGIGWRVR